MACYGSAVPHWSLVPRPRLRPFAHAAALLLGVTGCHAGATPAHPTAETQPTVGRPNTLKNAHFAEAAHELLRDGKRTPARAARLSSVVRLQLEHAGALFARGLDVRGANAVVGAFFFLRSDEANDALIDAASLGAIDGAIRRFSARGNEGRTLALLALKGRLVAAGSRQEQDVKGHVDALQKWTEQTRTGGPMQVLTAAQKQAVSRALFEPSPAHLTRAVDAVSKWIEQAVAINVAFQETRQTPEHDEAIEAFRALQNGAYVMAALYLRQGLAVESLAAIEGSAASRIARPGFFSKLRAAAVDGRAEDWRMLAREVGQIGSDTESEEGPLEAEILDASMWGIGLEAYRRDPKSLAIAHLLANELIEHELPEVAPLVLADALGTKPAAASLSSALELVANALNVDVREGSVDSARRIFAASARLFALADSKLYENTLLTTAASLRQRMAALELRAGNADAARTLMLEALKVEPTVSGLTTLATLQRQLGDTGAALETAERAFQLGSHGAAELAAAQARLLAFEIHRDAGAEDAARRALDDALGVVLVVRRLGGSSELGVGAETTLARVLDGYGEHERASQAMARALDLAEQHPSVLAQTMLAAIARAVTQRQVTEGRAALGRGIKADTDTDSLVYGALWLNALERSVGATSDGKVERVFAEAVNGESWTTRLARWAGGGVTDEELVKAAKTHADRVEAEFYVALRARTTNGAGAELRMTKLAQNPLVDLFEVRLARDLLARQLKLPLPDRVTLP